MKKHKTSKIYNNILPLPRNTNKTVSEDDSVSEQRTLQKELVGYLKNKDFNFDEWIALFDKFALNHTRFLYSAITFDILNEDDEEALWLSWKT